MSKQTEKIKALVEKRELARLGGGQKAIDKQHERGKYTAGWILGRPRLVQKSRQLFPII